MNSATKMLSWIVHFLKIIHFENFKRKILCHILDNNLTFSKIGIYRSKTYRSACVPNFKSISSKKNDRVRLIITSKMTTLYDISMHSEGFPFS